nr:uncharacterized protein LOC128684041 [Cherax quadricarinatus]
MQASLVMSAPHQQLPATQLGTQQQATVRTMKKSNPQQPQQTTTAQELVSLPFHSGTQLLNYADLALGVNGKGNLERQAQRPLDLITHSCKELGLKISAEKSLATMFKGPDPVNRLRIQDIEHDWTSSYLYLGIYIGKMLTFQKQAEYVRSRAVLRLNAMRGMTRHCAGRAKKYIMQHALLVLLTVLALSGVVTSYFYCQGGAYTVGGLAALRGPAFYGSSSSRRRRHRFHRRYRGPHQRRSRRRFGRAIQSASDEESLLFSAVSQLDHEGCILKLLCHLQTRKEDARSLEENVLVDMFASITETSHNAPFIHALYIGTKTHHPTECDSYFSKCSLNHTQLCDLLQQAWGCGFNIFNDHFLPLKSI